MKPPRFDAITLEVLWTRLISVVDEAAKAIVRTSFSTLSNEANDFACMRCSVPCVPGPNLIFYAPPSSSMHCRHNREDTL